MLLPIIDLAPGADNNALAVELARRIQNNLTHSPKKRGHFASLRGTVLIVAKDTGETLTMRFNHGRLTIHDGTIGIPALTFCATREALWYLWNTPAKEWPLHPKNALNLVFKPVAGGDIKIYGLISHPRTLWFFSSICSPPWAL